MRHAVIAVLLLAGQSAKPAFDVVSIRRNTSVATDGGMRVDPGGRFTATNVGIFFLVAGTYGEGLSALRPEQIVGAPDWLRPEHYDIRAKAADPGDMENFEKTRLLLRTMLEDRFKLRVHREQREMPVYALVRAKADGALGPRLKQTVPDCLAFSSGCGFGGGPINHIKAEKIPISMLAQILSSVTARMVVDRTGLEGGYNIDLEFSPDQAASDLPSIFTAVQEQLGLKLESTRAPVDVIVIDHVERPAED